MITPPPSALPNSSAPAGGRRTRCRARPIDPCSPRPSELLRVFFAAGLVAIAAAALAGVLYAVSRHPWLHWLALHLVCGLGRMRPRVRDPRPRGLHAEPVS